MQQLSTCVVRQFHHDEWPVYKAIRLKALQSDPQVFSSNYAREASYPDTNWQQDLDNPDLGVFGVFHDDHVIGMTGIVVSKDQAFVAKLWGSWLEPQWRGKGFSIPMYKARIEWAKKHPKIRVIAVSHRASNMASKHANQKHGFVHVGSQPHIWPDGTEEPEELYELKVKNNVS